LILHELQLSIKTSHSQESYYHQLLGAVLVHPELPTVLPLAPDAITRQDGATKNDCECNAAKRLLVQLRHKFPKLKLIVVEDSLAANGQLLHELNLRYIIGVKEGDHKALFAAVRTKLQAGEGTEFSYTDAHGIEQGYRFANDLPLNHTHPQLRVNFLEYWENKGESQLRFSWITVRFSWITDIELSQDNVECIMRGGRARWEIEQFHREDKQVTGLQGCQYRKARIVVGLFAPASQIPSSQNDA
jgi:hypothetical protein